MRVLLTNRVEREKTKSLKITKGQSESTIVKKMTLKKNHKNDDVERKMILIWNHPFHFIESL